MMPSDSVRNYTNIGYSQYGDDVSSVHHQQPVVVVRTFDHPGKSYYYRSVVLLQVSNTIIGQLYYNRAVILLLLGCSTRH